jgi:hypothetical protein
LRELFNPKEINVAITTNPSKTEEIMAALKLNKFEVKIKQISEPQDENEEGDHDHENH